jgi:hypothetical protein
VASKLPRHVARGRDADRGKRVSDGPLGSIYTASGSRPGKRTRGEVVRVLQGKRHRPENEDGGDGHLLAERGRGTVEEVHCCDRREHRPEGTAEEGLADNANLRAEVREEAIRAVEHVRVCHECYSEAAIVNRADEARGLKVETTTQLECLLERWLLHRSRFECRRPSEAQEEKLFDEISYEGA